MVSPICVSHSFPLALFYIYYIEIIDKIICCLNLKFCFADRLLFDFKETLCALYPLSCFLPFRDEDVL